MPKRKPMMARHPGGRIHVRKADLSMPPGEVRRLRDAAMSGLRAAEWGTELGRLYLAEKISERQYAAGKRWSALASEYSAACGCPRAPVSARLDPVGGSALDPDSYAGVREARRHARVVEGYVGAARVLQLTGAAAERAVVSVCEGGQVPAGLVELEALRSGLTVLASWWTERGKGTKPKR